MSSSRARSSPLVSGRRRSTCPHALTARLTCCGRRSVAQPCGRASHTAAAWTRELPLTWSSSRPTAPSPTASSRCLPAMLSWCPPTVPTSVPTCCTSAHLSHRLFVRLHLPVPCQLCLLYRLLLPDVPTPWMSPRDCFALATSMNVYDYLVPNIYAYVEIPCGWQPPPREVRSRSMSSLIYPTLQARMSPRTAGPFNNDGSEKGATCGAHGGSSRCRPCRRPQATGHRPQVTNR